MEQTIHVGAVRGLVKNNFTAVVSPTVSNDSTQGYSPGSTWVDSVQEKVFTCTNSAAGAAVWIAPTGSGITEEQAKIISIYTSLALGGA